MEQAAPDSRQEGQQSKDIQKRRRVLYKTDRNTGDKVMKTSELTGAALDWAVAKCLREHIDVDWFIERRNETEYFRYSTDWAQGGPIIERERLTLKPERDNKTADEFWTAISLIRIDDYRIIEFGPTPLIAAMRCYVAYRLGDEVEIPDVLLPNTQPGNCPECGEPADIWEAIAQQWMCSYCNWKGRQPTRPEQTPYSSTDERHHIWC